MKWNGKQYPLEKFTGLHRSAFVNMAEAASHVTVQLPTEHSRVGYLLDNITSTDPSLMAAIASVKIETNLMRDNFEEAVAFILPSDPYTRSNNRFNRDVARISDTNALKNSQMSKTGVDLRWHTRSEYAQLSQEQKQELYEWQQSNTDAFEKSREASKKNHAKKVKAGKQGGNQMKKLRSEISKLKAANKDLKSKSQESSEPSVEELRACFEPFVSAAQGTPNASNGSNPDPRVAAAALKLKNILKRGASSEKK